MRASCCAALDWQSKGQVSTSPPGGCALRTGPRPGAGPDAQDFVDNEAPSPLELPLPDFAGGGFWNLASAPQHSPGPAQIRATATFRHYASARLTPDLHGPQCSNSEYEDVFQVQIELLEHRFSEE